MEAENKRLKMELGKVQKANKEMEESAKFLSDTFEDCKNMVSEIYSLLKDFKSFEKIPQEVDQIKQYQRINNLEIHGIPETKNEQLPELAIKLAKDVVHRLPSSKVEMPKPILIKFCQRWKKNEMLSAKKKLNSVDSTSLVPGTARRNIYINEHLTPMNRLLHKKTRDLRDKINFVWTKDCKVFVRQTEEDGAVWVQSEDDLKKFMG